MSEIGTLYKGIRYSLIHLGPSKWGKELLDPLNTYLGLTMVRERPEGSAT